MNRLFLLVLPSILLSQCGPKTLRDDCGESYAIGNHPISDVRLLDLPKEEQKDPGYSASFRVHFTESDRFNLTTLLSLDKGNWITSPHSEDEVMGHFVIELEDTTQVKPIENLIETPVSVAEYNPALNETLRIIRNNSALAQPLQILAEDDFEVTGVAWFVLEPRCTPEQVPFVIARKDGVLSVRHVFATGSTEC